MMDEEMNELLTAYQKFDDRLAKVWSKLRDESDAKPVSLLGHALNAVGTARYKLEEAARALSLAAQHFET